MIVVFQVLALVFVLGVVVVGFLWLVNDLRDKKGRFVKGHKAVAIRDLVTGRFVSKKSIGPVVSDYDKTRYEVDLFLDSRVAG